MRYLLIIHGEGSDRAHAIVCDTEAERELETKKAIYGSPEDADAECWAKELAELKDDGWLRFEGDPPIQWVNAEVSSDDRLWHRLSSINLGPKIVELLAATSDDGIGVIARWKLREDGGWDVTAMDTESDEGMKPVTDFHEGECVPPTPPITV